jgi:type III secretory pathway component EscR
MTNENEFDYVDMTDEELARQALNDAIESAQITLQLSENCYRKFGKQLLSETQKSYFENVANGILPTDKEQATLDNEQITLDMQAVIQARELNKQQAAKLGDAWQPELRLEDKTEGFGVN